MNIFWLSLNIKKCAKYHCDKHVVKMILESAQMLCTAHHYYYGITGIYLVNREYLYKKTSYKHPCTAWVIESYYNYMKLYDLYIELCKEYTYRYKKIHLCEIKLLKLLSTAPYKIPCIFNNKLPIAIANKELLIYNVYGEVDVVESYRRYYVIEKSRFALWNKGRDIPKWYIYDIIEEILIKIFDEKIFENIIKYVL